ncbi:MAG TPA: hypothetical protein VKV15_11905 [Bryobacteraceae bacterium]|nr:hypothetical protein [Bryobacteraceae bacterium]
MAHVHIRVGRRRVALNQDRSVNSLSNPAVPGSILTLWANGAGLFQSLTNGEIVQPALPVLVLPLSVVGGIRS